MSVSPDVVVVDTSKDPQQEAMRKGQVPARMAHSMWFYCKATGKYFVDISKTEVALKHAVVEEGKYLEKKARVSKKEAKVKSALKEKDSEIKRLRLALKKREKKKGGNGEESVDNDEEMTEE